MARTAKRYKKNTEKKVLGIPVCMAAIYVRLSVDLSLIHISEPTRPY